MTGPASDRLTGPEIVRLDVSNHAARRFFQRGGASTIDRALVDVLCMAAEGVEVFPPASWFLENHLDELHRDDDSDARYIRSGGWLLVVRDNGPDRPLVVITVFRPDHLAFKEVWWW